MGFGPAGAQARRTFKLDTIRAVPNGFLETLSITFAVVIAVRVFDAPWRAKAWLVAAPSLGLFLSLFMVQLVRRTGWSVNVASAGIWVASAVCLVIAAIWDDSLVVFLSAVGVALLGLTLAVPLMAQIYRRHYPGANRGRLFATSGVVRKVAAIAVAASFGWVLRQDLGAYRWLLVIYGAACVWMAACVFRMDPVHLDRSKRVRLFAAFSHVKTDRSFRNLLISWMILGFGNLLCFSLFVEYVSNPEYGYQFDELTIATITGVIPEVMFLIFVIGWGVIFDRMNFFLVRTVINLLFAAGILFYFVGDGVWALCVGIALHGIARAGGNVAWSLWVTKFAKGEHVAEYMSVHTFLTGTRGIIAPFIAFPLVQSQGPETIGLIGAGLILAATVIIFPSIGWKAERKEKEPVDPDPRVG